MIKNAFTQNGFRVRLEWGERGIDALAACAVLIVVDVLSFSTSVDIALGAGARVLPMRVADPAAHEAAAAAGAVLAGERRWTLRPSSLLDIPAGTVLALPSPNGASLCVRAGDSATVLTGCLRNATAVAELARSVAGGRPIGVIPAGERWGITDGPLRPCVADQLGAGAIVSALLDVGVEPASPEALLAAHTYRVLDPVDDLPGILMECASGRELIDQGHAADVALAAEVDISRVMPVLVDGVLRDAH